MGNAFGRKKDDKKEKDNVKDGDNVVKKKISKDVVFSKIIENIEELNGYEDDDFTQFETKRVRDLFLAIDDSFFTHKKLHDEITDVLLKNGYLDVTFKFLYYYAEEGFVGRKEINLSSSNILNTLWSATSDSFHFRKRVGELGFVKLFLCKLSDQEFIQLMDINDRVKYIVQSMLAILHNITRSAELKDLFKESKALSIIKKFINANSPEIKALAYMFIANVATNEDDVSIVDTTKTIPFLIEILDQALKSKDKSFSGENAKFPADVIIESIHKLAVEDANKLIIHENNGVRLLIDVLKSLNVMKKEKHAAANAIWMLCYDDKIKKFVRDQQDTYKVIVKLAETSVHDEIRVSCKGILMLLNDEIEKKAELFKKKAISEDSKKISAKPLLSRQKEVVEQAAGESPGHIMISYNKFSRETCLKIKNKLDQQFDTWMDINCIYGDALDSMADAVEKASVVLICMTESYKESANCAIEAKYTLALRKPYVPLRLQSKYQPRGWLGMLLNYKIFIDFADKPFEDSYNLLIKEIFHVLNQNKMLKSQSTTAATASKLAVSSEASNNNQQHLTTNHYIPKVFKKLETTPSTNIPIGFQWSNSQLLDWLDQIHLEAYKNKFKDFDGKRLHRLYDWKKKDSQFYYNFIHETFESQGSVNKTTDILIFEEELEKLFT